MAFVKRNFSVLLWCLCVWAACDGGAQRSASVDQPLKTVDDAVLDSLGELAYSHFSSFEKDPEGFLSPLDRVELGPAQRETYWWILVNMAYAFQQHSQILQSAAYYEKALLYDQEHGIADPWDRLTYVYKPLANNYTVLSDYGKAERFLLQAMNEAEHPRDIASFSNNLVLMYTYQGDHEKALYYGQLGLNNVTDSTHLRVLLHNSLSNLYWNRDQLDSARWHNAQALHLGPELIHEWSAAARVTTWSQQASFKLMDGAREQARMILHQALDLENRMFPDSRHREKAALLNKLGEVELLSRNENAAERRFRQGLSHYEQENLQTHTSTYTKVDLLKNLAKAFSFSQPDSAWTYYQQAVEADFAFQQGVTTKASHLTNNKWNRKLLEEVYAFSRQVPLDSAARVRLLWMTELTKGRLLWNDLHRTAYWSSEQNELNEALEYLQSLYARRDRAENPKEILEIDEQLLSLQATFELEERYFTRNAAQPDFSDFQKNLQQTGILHYSYFLHEDSTLSIFKNQGGRVSYWHSHQPGLIDRLEQFKQRYFTDSPHAYNAHPADYRQLANELREELLPDLDGSSELIQLSLDNELFILPFDALCHRDRFLVEDFTIHYVHSLIARKTDAEPDFPAHPIQVLYRGDYDPPLADLQFVKSEVKSLRRQFQTQLYAPADQPSASLNEIFDRPGIIHIAAHATVETDQPPTILLDQRISTEQLRYYSIQAPLVVLSACNTASGQLLLSEGLESLNRAFLSKGVQGVIATHWFANDDSMLDLTRQFYQHLTRHHSPVRALAEAKRTYLQEQSASWRNPWYWANMSYTGRDIKIDLPKRTGLYRRWIR